MRNTVLCLFALTSACTGGDESPLEGSTTIGTAASAATNAATTGPGGDTSSGAATEPGSPTGTGAVTGTGDETGATADTGTSGGPDEVLPPCLSVEELSAPNGLTSAMRQLSGAVTGPLLPPGPFSLLEYSTIFGTSPDTYPVDEPDPTGFGFPGTNQNRLTFTIERDKYISLKFRAPSDGFWDQRVGAFFLIPAGTFVSASIGRCPGQFADDPAWPMPAGCTAFGEITLPWKIGAEGVGCVLEPGATYYVNVINASLDSPATTNACMSDTCKFKLMNNHNP